MGEPEKVPYPGPEGTRRDIHRTGLFLEEEGPGELREARGCAGRTAWRAIAFIFYVVTKL
jgi:hypothetical protein